MRHAEVEKELTQGCAAHRPSSRASGPDGDKNIYVQIDRQETSLRGSENGNNSQVVGDHDMAQSTDPHTAMSNPAYRAPGECREGHGNGRDPAYDLATFPMGAKGMNTAGVMYANVDDTAVSSPIYVQPLVRTGDGENVVSNPLFEGDDEKAGKQAAEAALSHSTIADTSC